MPTTLTPRPQGDAPVFEFVAASGIPQAAEAYARTKIARLYRVAPGPVLHVRVKLQRAATRGASGRRCIGQATVDVGGRIVRAHVTAGDALETVDLLQERLRTQLVRMGERRHSHRGTRRAAGGAPQPPAPEPPAVVPGQAPAEPLPALGPDVLLEEVAAEAYVVEEAAFGLEMLDADFFLFREATTGADAVVHHRDDGRLGLVLFGTATLAPESLSLPAGGAVVVEPRPEPLAPAAAVQRLLDGPEPFVAAVDPGSGRPLVAYHRWDGAVAVITPLPEPARPSAPWAARRRLAAELDRLSAVRNALRAEGLDAMTEAEDVAELSDVDQHPADLGTETFERERDLSLLHEVEAEIGNVHRALVHLSRGTYARCEACGEPIPDARLAALPAARLCLADQERAEAAAARDRRLG
jgi:RNA polymerase-binding transcription factor DksA/ribosome-associated translation inhibitor RaiA